MKVFVVQPVQPEPLAKLQELADVEMSPFLDRRLTARDIAQ